MLMGRGASRSYFVGCSDGGREALQEAQRFPNDFDGIIVGSPVNDQVGEFASSYLYDMQATLGGPQTNGVPDAYIPSSKLPLLSNAALAQCAGNDGGLASDLFLNDPRQCRFRPEVVQCRRGQDPGHLPDRGAGRCGTQALPRPARGRCPALPRPRARRRGRGRRLGQLDHRQLARVARLAVHARQGLRVQPDEERRRLRLPRASTSTSRTTKRASGSSPSSARSIRISGRSRRAAAR
jgi:hypothetical protein